MDTAVDLRPRVVALEQAAAANLQRFIALEDWQRKWDVAQAAKDAEWRGMDARFNERFTNIEKQIGGIAETLKFLSRTFIGAVILAFAAFIINGGLKIL